MEMNRTQGLVVPDTKPGATVSDVTSLWKFNVDAPTVESAPPSVLTTVTVMGLVTVTLVPEIVVVPPAIWTVIVAFWLIAMTLARLIVLWRLVVASLNRLCGN